MFVSIEGADGVGKTTQAIKLVQALRSISYDTEPRVHLVREPGGTTLGKKLRDIIFSGDVSVHSDTEAVLFLADHMEMHREVDALLKKGEVVVADRYIDSAIVYQGIYKDKVEFIRDLHETTGCWSFPYLTICIDLDSEIAIERMSDRKDKNFKDLAPLEFHRKIREAYKLLGKVTVKDHPERTWVVVDGSVSVDKVHEHINAVVLEHLAIMYKKHRDINALLRNYKEGL